MLRFALKGALARKLRLALTATAIVLGVAFVAGTYVLTDTLNATFDRIFGDAEQGVAVVVQGTQSFGAGFGQEGGATEERAFVPESVRQQVAAVPGVKDAAGVASGYAQLVYQGRAVGNGRAPTLGSAWVGNISLNPVHVVAGQPPQRSGDVIIDEHSARKFHIPVGATAMAIVQGTEVPVHVVGYLRFGKESTLAGAALTTFTATQAQQLLLGQSGVWSNLQVSAQPGVSQQTLAARVTQALRNTPHVEVLTEHDYVKAESKRFKQQLKFFNILLLIFAFIAVFVAVFIIFNTFTVLVAQRTRELALMRAVGASRRQIMVAVMSEAALVGLVAGCLGLLGGIGIAAILRALIEALSGGGLITVGLQVLPRTIVISLLVGLVVTVVAAVVPAVRAARIPPVAAMRDDYVLPAPSLRRRTRIGVAALVIGAALLIVGVRSGKALEIGLGALAMFRGVVSLSPVLSRPIVGGIGRALPRVWGMSGRLARENALRSPRRTAATASALMIGIALTTTMSIVAASITTSAAAQIDKSIGADFIITANGFGPVPDVVAGQIRGVPDIEAVTSVQPGDMKVFGDRVQIAGVTPGTVQQTLRLHVVAGDTNLRLGEVIVDTDTAKSKRLHLGSRLPVTFALTGRQVLTVAGIYDTNPIAGHYMIGTPTYDANFRNRLDIVIAVKAVHNANLGAIRTSLAHILAKQPTLKLADQSEFKADQKRQINQVLIFVLALLLLSLVIAWLGIVNTLALSVFERTREIGLLRAVGMATKQVRRMVRLEAVVIALFGALLGVVLGLGYGAALVQALHDQGINETSIPVGQLIGYLVIGVIAGITAAWWPARRASRLDVLHAISSE